MLVIGRRRVFEHSQREDVNRINSQQDNID
jgi:hypothetical protein